MFKLNIFWKKSVFSNIADILSALVVVLFFKNAVIWTNLLPNKVVNMQSRTLSAHLLLFREMLSISDVHDGDPLKVMCHLLGLPESVVVGDYHDTVFERVSLDGSLQPRSIHVCAQFKSRRLSYVFFKS